MSILNHLTEGLTLDLLLVVVLLQCDNLNYLNLIMHL